MESRLEEIHGESADMVVLRKRLAGEMEDERKQFEKELADRDHAADMTRTKYQRTVAFVALATLTNTSSQRNLLNSARSSRASGMGCPNCARSFARLVQTTMSYKCVTMMKFTLAELGRRSVSDWRPR